LQTLTLHKQDSPRKTFSAESDRAVFLLFRGELKKDSGELNIFIAVVASPPEIVVNVK
jgi:hypothetical protein